MKFKHSLLSITLFFILILSSFAQQESSKDNIVKLFYFLPNDRVAQPNINEKMDDLIKKAQQFYANEMEKNGFGRKTFTYETDKTGNAVVHHVLGKQEDASYWKNPAKAFREIDKNLYKYNKTIVFVALDISKKVLLKNACGLAYPGKRIILPASSSCFNVGVTAHELGHAFGLPHGYGGLKGISKYAARWLDVNRYFNPNRIETNSDTEAQIKMYPSSIAYPPNNPHYFFEITDPDSLYLARFITGATILHSGEFLTGMNEIAKFTTYGETLKNNRVKVNTADINGGATWGKWVSLDGVQPNMVLDISINANNPQDGLIGYWTLDEAKGPYVFNSIGNKYHGKIKESVILQPNKGKIGGALTTKWKHAATIENGAELLNDLSAFTISLWVKSDNINTDRGFISSKRPNKKEQSFSLRYDATGSKGSGTDIIKATIKTSGGVQTYESASNSQTTKWQHIALTWESGQKLKLYINGVLDQPTFNSSAKQGKLVGSDRFVIGKGSLGNHIAWRGLVDDVRLYNRVLSAIEISRMPHVTNAEVGFYGVSVAGAADITDETINPNVDIRYVLTVTNSGNINDTINLVSSGNNEAKLSHKSVSLAPRVSSEVILTIPRTVGEHTVSVVASSEGDVTKTAQITTTTTIKH
ncbi:MAG: hypothetical protein OXD54_03765 [Candidatus Poribacteria bacterium]|nr:hypothetical protein [Candidatus Poribacteria bacterium]